MNGTSACVIHSKHTPAQNVKTPPVSEVFFYTCIPPKYKKRLSQHRIGIKAALLRIFKSSSRITPEILPTQKKAPEKRGFNQWGIIISNWQSS